MRTLLTAPLALLMCLCPVVAAEDSDTPQAQPAADQAADQAAANLPQEKAQIDGIPQPLVVSALRSLTFPKPKVPDLARTELWFRSFDGKAWSEWQQHGTVFDVGSAIVWSPPEGIWQVYLRPVLTSGLKGDAPGPNPPEALSTTFVIQRTAPAVTIKYPAAKAFLRGGFKYTVQWEATSTYLRSTPITLLYSRDGADWKVIAANIANKGSYDWVTPIDMTVTGQLKILARDKADNVGDAVIGDLLIDSINPTGRVLGPPIFNSLSTVLQLDIKDGGPAGLQSAQLWLSVDDGTTWTAGPWIRDPRQLEYKFPSDGVYRLAILAIDKAGNTSPTPKGKGANDFSITIDTTPPLVQLSAAIGIMPANAAQGNMQRAFKKGDRVAVQFTVKDANPAPNSAAVYLSTGGNKWEQLASGLPLDQVYRFELPDIKTKTAQIKVTAVDQAGNIGEATAPEQFEIQTGVEIEHGSSIDPFAPVAK